MDSAEPPVAPDAVRRYLAQLAAELEHRDAALRHDALIDAEAHLRAAVAAGSTPERAVADYGSPAEIAAAYSGADGAARPWRTEPAPAGRPVGTSPAPAAPGAPERRRGMRDIPVVGIWFDSRAWGALAYFGLVGFPLAIAYFTWAIVVGAIAIGTSTILVGIPILVFLLGSARAMCLFEGKVVETFLRVRMPRRTQPVEGVDHVGFWHRIWCWLRDVRSWMSLGYLLGNFPVSLVAFVTTFAFSVVGAALCALPLLDALGIPIGRIDADGDPVRIRFLFHDIVPDADGALWLPDGAAIPSLFAGLLLLTATLWMARGLGWVYGHVVQAIQVARPTPTVPPRVG